MAPLPFTIRTPIGTLEERDQLDCTSWESHDCRTWIHVLRFGVGAMDDPWYAILARAGEEPRVFSLGGLNGATDVEIVREILGQLGITGPVVSGQS